MYHRSTADLLIGEIITSHTTQPTTVTSCPQYWTDETPIGYLCITASALCTYASHQVSPLPTDYVGCFYKDSPVLHPDHRPVPEEHRRWIEPQAALFGSSSSYVTYARGSMYALSARMLQWMLRLPDGAIRYFRSEGGSLTMALTMTQIPNQWSLCAHCCPLLPSCLHTSSTRHTRSRPLTHTLHAATACAHVSPCSDVSVGVLNAALNTSQWDDQRLCAPACHRGGLAFYNISCNGLCSMALLHQLHEDPACSGPGTDHGQ